MKPLRAIHWRMIIGLTVVALVVCAIGVIALDRQVVRGFAAHLGRQPSVVYASRLTLQREQPIDPSILSGQLERLGFHAVDVPPVLPGEYQWSNDGALQLV